MAEIYGDVTRALRRRPFWQQIAFLVLATSLPLLLSSLLMFNRMAASERKIIMQTTLVSAKTLASLVDNEISNYAAIGVTLSHSPNLQNRNLPAFLEEAKQALEFVPGSWLTVSEPDGQMALNTLTSGAAALPKHAVPDIIQKGFAERKYQVSDVVLGPVSQRWVTFVEIPVFREGAPLYSLAIAIPPERFLALIARQFINHEFVAIIDRQKNIVARVPDHAARVGTQAAEGWRAVISRAPEGWAQTQVLEGDWALIAYAPTEYGWTVGIAQLETALAKPGNVILWSAAVSTLILTALSAAIAAMLARRTSLGMQALAQAAAALGEGRPVILRQLPFAEAAMIGEALVSASADLTRRNDLLERANTELDAKVALRTSELVNEMERREAAERTLRQAQKMDSIGQLTGGIAHDFNNMLTIIIGNLDTLQRRMKSLAQTDTLHRPVEAAMQGARSAAKLTHRLLAFSRQQPLEPVPLDLNALVAGLTDLLTSTVGDGIEIQAASGAGLWLTLADPNQVENALVNLAVNARDAMAGRGKMTIETENISLDEAYAARFGDTKPGQYVMLSVSDTGTGIDRENLDRVFEPFFSTKEPGKGTGLGLSMIHGFVKQSGGHIQIYSEPGKGTSVRMYLPRLLEANFTAAAPARDKDQQQTPARAKPGETILLVEDEDGVRDYAAGVLEDLGYRVAAASSAEEALRLIETLPRADLLFTDVVLGSALSGRELADRIVAMRPNLPVLFTTGYSREAILHQGRVEPGVNLLSKPFTRQELALKVRAAIDLGSRRDAAG